MDETAMWTVGTAVGISSTVLSLSNDEDADLRRAAVTASIERRIGDRWALQLGGGASLGGDVTVGSERYTFDPGWVATLGGSFRILDGEGMLPFLLVALTAGVGSAQVTNEVESAMFTAVDLRLSGMVGKMFWNGFGPYAVARVFGGPVFWERHGESITGSDRYHVQLGAGLIAAAPGLMSAFVEIVPLGELAATTGLAVSF